MFRLVQMVLVFQTKIYFLVSLANRGTIWAPTAAAFFAVDVFTRNESVVAIILKDFVKSLIMPVGVVP